MSRFNIVLAIFVTMLEIAPRLALASPNDTKVNEYLQSELQHIATLNERSDVASTRLYISSSPVINSAIIWQTDGGQRYPATAQVLHVLDQPVIAAEKRLKALAKLAHPWRAEKADASGTELFYCYRTQQIICALLNVEQLASLFSVSPDEINQQLVLADNEVPNHTWVIWTVAALAILVISAGSILFSRRQQATKATQTLSQETGFRLGDLTIYPKQLRALRQDLAINLTDKDVKLLRHFASHPCEVITKQELYDAAWGREFMPNSRALEQHIITLRKKLDPEKKLPPVIETVHGQGYRFSPPA
ncbi:MAG: response regulator transcription factor [Gammaproteobacteria bacterium]|nr:response regulator transcription factor [Gammaproteobacteria bacterium]